MRGKRIAVGLFLLLLCLASGALADRIGDLNAQSVLSEEAHGVKANITQSNRYVVYLPGWWDPTRIRLTLEGAETLTVAGEAYENGAVVDVSPWLGKPVKVGRNGVRMTAQVTFLQGSDVMGLFVDVDPERYRKVYRDKTLTIDEGHVQAANPDGSLAYDGELVQFKGRGNNTYSSQYPKKPYQIKLANKADLGGMGKARTWLLISNHLDLTLVRNQVTLDLARAMGLKNAVECAQADVWINGEYQGLYLLTEKIQIQKSRVNIRNLEEATEELNEAPPDSYPTFREGKMRGYEIPQNPEDITGGYILEQDKAHRYENDSDNGFVSETRMFMVIEEPTCASREQVEYISERFNRLCRAIAGDGTDPVTGAAYTELLDTESFAIKFLIEDFCKNFDALAGSQFFYKDSDSVDPRFYAGPCWDYDLSYGNVRIKGGGSCWDPKGSWVTTVRNGQTSWYKQIWEQKEFRSAVKEMYWERFRPLVSLLLSETESAQQDGIKSLTAYFEEISASSRMNFTRYLEGVIPGIYAPNGKNNEKAKIYLRDWMGKRIQSMDAEYALTEED